MKITYSMFLYFNIFFSIFTHSGLPTCIFKLFKSLQDNNQNGTDVNQFVNGKSNFINTHGPTIAEPPSQATERMELQQTTPQKGAGSLPTQ